MSILWVLIDNIDTLQRGPVSDESLRVLCATKRWPFFEANLSDSELDCEFSGL